MKVRGREVSIPPMWARVAPEGSPIPRSGPNPKQIVIEEMTRELSGQVDKYIIFLRNISSDFGSQEVVQGQGDNHSVWYGSGRSQRVLQPPGVASTQSQTSRRR